MLTKEIILEKAKQKGILRSAQFVSAFDVSRQYVSKMLSSLVEEGKLIKIGSTRNATYVLPAYADAHPDTVSNRYSKKFKNISLEEHKVLDDIEHSFLPFKKLSENIKSIFTYAFSEMLNNAIEHSKSETIQVTVLLQGDELSFVIDDHGIGVYRNIMHKRHLNSEIESIQDLLKGRMTTAPKLHSGEGIFFTSKVGDLFVLESYGYQFIADNNIKDIFVNKVKGIKKGTRVSFKINTKDKHHLNDIFKQYTNLAEKSDYGFDKTEIRVRLYTMGGVHISRSQARRVLSGLEKFRIVVMDYDRVPMIGQAFADEVYRVFKEKRPDVTIQDINMNEAVKFMVDRAKTEAKKSRE